MEYNLQSGLKIKLIRLSGVKNNKVFHTYKITIPKRLVDLLGFASEKELIIDIIVVDGKKGLFIYKP